MTFGTSWRYLIVGIANTIIGYGVILILQFAFGMRPLAANALGYMIGLAVSYALNRRFTFNSRRSHRASVLAFVGAAAVCYLLNVVVLQVLLTVFDLPAAAAQALAITAYTIAFYFANKYVVFKENRA
ncbi:MAG: GtrA family protein [Rhodoferax sp.]|nr:GtrA family protein [Rhodoferax sp.]